MVFPRVVRFSPIFDDRLDISEIFLKGPKSPNKKNKQKKKKKNKKKNDIFTSSATIWIGLFPIAGCLVSFSDCADPDQTPRLVGLILVCTVCQLPFWGFPDLGKCTVQA